MSKAESNLYLKVLKTTSDHGVNSFHYIARSLDISEELLDMVIQSLLEKGYLKYIDEKEFKKEASYRCKFCPFVKECSENLPSVFYEISQKGKEILRNKKD